VADQSGVRLTFRSLFHRGSGQARAAIWVLAAILAAVIVWWLQISDRAPLVWDEAARVDSGAMFAQAIRAGDWLGAWQWINLQTLYPFIGPGLNGLVLLATSNSVAAAWVPSLTAYAVAGILAGRLATELGSGAIGAWSAGALTWLAPIFARVAAGAWTEPIGACLLLALLIAITRMKDQSSLRAPATVGLLAALAWFLKYDYGLLALGTVGLSGLVAVAMPGDRKLHLKQTCVALAAAIGPIAAWFLVNPSAKLQSVFHYVGQQSPGSLIRIDLAYYARALFSGGEVGLVPIVALLFVVSVVAAIFQSYRPEMRAPLISLGLWYLEYSIATFRFPRFLGVIVPLLAVFAGLAIGQLVQRAHFQSSTQRRMVLLVAAVIGASQLGLQAADSGTGLAAPFYFLASDRPAADALSFASTHLIADSGPVLMLGQTNEFSPAALQLAWTERLGRPAPSVQAIPETGLAVSRQSLVAAMDMFGIRQVVAVDVRPGSRLDTVDYRTAFPSQPLYVALALQLESSGLLKRIAGVSLESGHLGVTVWTYGLP
jgi:hypothetical protein